MRALQLGFLWSAILAASCFFTTNAAADFCTGFENYNGAPQGMPLTNGFGGGGQQGWYNPVAGSVDFNVYTYLTGNPLMIPDNPEGGLFWVGGRGAGGTGYARAQHDNVYSNTVWEYGVDLCANFNGATATNNVGSLSCQPTCTGQSYPAFIQLLSWVTGQEGASYNLGFLVFNAAGVIMNSTSGVFPSPQWQGLAVRNWYRCTLKVDFATNTCREASIRDITGGGAATVVDVSGMGWYLQGGAAGLACPPTGFRFFAGSANAGNITAWDNLCVRELGTTAVEATTWGSIKAHFDAPAPGIGKTAAPVAMPEIQ